MLGYITTVSNFKFSGDFYRGEFVRVMAGCYRAYRCLMSDGIKMGNDENEIRDTILYRYLRDQGFLDANKLDSFLFDKEVDEYGGRADIRVMPIKDNYRGVNSYYIIECKRIDQKRQSSVYGLNAKYIANGIYRFVSEYYSCRCHCNGMLGFVVSCIDIDKNIGFINGLIGKRLKDDKGVMIKVHREGRLRVRKDCIPQFPYVYISEHVTVSGKKITLYHLMFDLSKNIKQKS